MKTTLTTNGVKPESRSTHWHQTIAATYFPLDLRFRDPENFKGQIDGWSLGRVSLSHLESEALMYRRLPKHLNGENREELLITIPMVSQVNFTQCDREVAANPGSFLIERSYEPYEFNHKESARLWVMKVSTSALGGRIREPDRFCGMQFNATNGAGGLFVDMLQNIPKRYDTLGDEVRELVGQQLIDLLALALHDDERTLTSGRSSVRSAHISRAGQFAARNLHRHDLDPAMIADECGISVRYLHELFRDTNQTVGQWIRDMRLEAAREDLRSPADVRSIAEICISRGFSDHAQFSRVFKQSFGSTPSEFRNEHQSQS